MTVERFLVVRYPLVAKTAFNWKRSLYTSIGIAIFSIVYNFSRLFEFTYQDILDSRTNSTVIGYLVVSSPLRDNLTYEIAFVYITYLIVQYVIPLGLLMVLNFSIYIGVSAKSSI